MKRILGYGLSIGAALLVGALGSLATTSAIPTWYTTLIKPALTPPSWVFGPVWTLLYVLMGIAAYRVFERRKKYPRLAFSTLALYVMHLGVNAFWSIAFFGLRSPETGIAVISVLWTMILVLTILFFKFDKVSGMLLLPYLAWVSFASYLNRAFSLLN